MWSLLLASSLAAKAHMAPVAARKMTGTEHAGIDPEKSKIVEICLLWWMASFEPSFTAL
jgi:hypothetical protein